MSSDMLQAAHHAVKSEDWTSAWTLTNALLNKDPDKPEALFLLGSAMRAAGNLGLAYQVLRRALAQETKQINLWMVFAATLHDLNRYDEAREAMMVAHRMLPKDAMPLANIGATYIQQGKWRDAIEWCDKAIGIDPENYIARISRNFAHLSMGRWRDGWEDAAWLYGRHLPVRVYNPPELEEPTWDGTPDLVVAVQADQGMGDIIMFAQCLPEMAKVCKEVVLECPPKLEELMKRSFPEITVHATLKDVKQSWALERVGTDRQIQAHLHISHIGKFFRRKDAEFPRKPYLKLDPVRVAWWKNYLSEMPRPWIGIAYEGGIQATLTESRSMPIAEMGPIIRLAGTAFDLSYKDNRMEVSRWNIDNPEQVVFQKINAEDYDATASLIAAMDEIVTVTTTVAHACGAMGRHAYVLVPSVPAWRYAYRMEDGGMIWYPKGSVKLFRQKSEEETFAPAIKRVARELSGKIKQLHAKEAA